MGRITIGKIEARNARLKTDAGKEVTDFEFFQSAGKEAEVLAFKRFVVHGEYEFDHPPGSFKLIVNPKSDLVIVSTGKSNFRPRHVVEACNQILPRFMGIENLVQLAGVAILPVEEPPNENYSICRVKDALRFVNVLHDIRDHGSFEFQWREKPIT